MRDAEKVRHLFQALPKALWHISKGMIESLGSFRVFYKIAAGFYEGFARVEQGCVGFYKVFLGVEASAIQLPYVPGPRP